MWLRESLPPFRDDAPPTTVEYTVRNYTDINEIKRLIFTDPRKLSLNEMFAATSAMDPASPEYEEAFRVAVRMYPESTDANLNAANIEMRDGNLESAARHLEKAGDSPEATYASGIADVVGAACKQSERGGSKEEFSEKIHMSVVILV